VRFPGAADHNNFVELAAAGLWTTPTDLLKATAAIQSSLTSQSGFLTQSTANMMLSRVIDADASVHMALGWFINDELFAHPGMNYPGYNTYVCGSRTASRGVAVMFNSSLGHEMAKKQIVSALYYLKGWSRSASLPSYFEADEHVPYAAPDGTAVDASWKDWTGTWDGGWHMVDSNGPCLRLEGFEAMRLRPAAAPRKVFDDGRQEILLVVDGLRIAVCLTWEQDARIIQLVQEKTKVLRKCG
jgi:hypothetical protein